MGGKLKATAFVVVVVAVAFSAFFQFFVVEQPDWQAELTIGGSHLKFRRHGSIMEIWGDDNPALARALGYAHAKDRLVQMVFQRVIAQGRLSECLVNEEKLIKTDTFFRELGFARDARNAIKEGRLSQSIVSYLQAYADGVNHYMQEQKERFSFEALSLPLEFTLVQYIPEPWQPSDTLTTLKLMCYVGLAGLQGDVEKFIIQAVKGGVDPAKMRSLFAPHLDNLDDELIELVKKVNVEQSLLYKSFLEGGAPFNFPTFMASNNWVVSPALSKDNSAIQSNDPHLEINRIPGIWYEVLFHYNDKEENKYWTGITVPGIPGITMGRTSEVTYGFTYGFMDQLDYFIEEVKDGKYKRVDEAGNVEWKSFKVRTEILKPKGDKAFSLTFLENDNGILELSGTTERKLRVDPHDNGSEGTIHGLPDGYYLARRWSWGDLADEDFKGVIPPPYFRTVEEAQMDVKYLALSTNFLFTDKKGNIAYQQTGRLPKRGPKHTGLLPGIGWLKEYRWEGMVDPSQLNTFKNPEKGWIATANDNWQSPNPDHPVSITISMGPNRRDRADELIKGWIDKGEKLTPEHMKAIQLDLYSKEAEYYMKILKPLLPSTVAGEVLKEWDLRYNKESQGAVLFEMFWEKVLMEVYGNWTFGLDAFQELRAETGFTLVFHWYFDRPILAEQKPNSEGVETVDNIAWFGKEGRTALFKRIVQELFSAKAYPKRSDIPTYGDIHSMKLKNILFDGKLPAFTGFDSEPIALEGNRNTMSQGNIFKMMGRLSSFAPSWRFISEVGKDEMWTSLPSGPSGRRFSSLYYNHNFYFTGQYHHIQLLDSEMERS